MKPYNQRNKQILLVDPDKGFQQDFRAWFREAYRVEAAFSEEELRSHLAQTGAYCSGG
jgi:hypothetical protein